MNIFQIVPRVNSPTGAICVYKTKLIPTLLLKCLYMYKSRKVSGHVFLY